MLLRILGSGTTSWDMDRTCASYHLTQGPTQLLFDCGAGSLYRMSQAGIDPLAIDALVLSHTQHPDHAGEVAAFLFAQNYARREPRTAPLRLIGPTGTEEFYEHQRASFPAISPRAYTLELEELGEDRRSIGEVELDASPVQHGDVPALGFRVKARDRIFTYSGDSGPCDALSALCQDADLALVECSYAEGQGRIIGSHLSAREVGELAAAARVRQLVITHRYAIGDLAGMESQIREQYDGPLGVAEDLQLWSIGEDNSITSDSGSP